MSDKEFPDAEDFLLELLEQVTVDGQPAETVTATPADIDRPMIRVLRVGRNSTTPGQLTQTNRVEVACFAPDRETAKSMDRQVEKLVLACKASAVNGMFVDNAREDTSPGTVPYEAPDTRRVLSYWVLSWRRQ